MVRGHQQRFDFGLCTATFRYDGELMIGLSVVNTQTTILLPNSKRLTMINLVPPIGTEIRFKADQATLSKDERTYICRITYDDAAKDWIMASTYDPKTDRWVPITKLRRIGLIVFLNDKPESSDTHIVVSKIKSSGKSVYADTLSK